MYIKKLFNLPKNPPQNLPSKVETEPTLFDPHFSVKTRPCPKQSPTPAQQKLSMALCKVKRARLT
jgi:hypothetical protein